MIIPIRDLCHNGQEIPQKVMDEYIVVMTRLDELIAQLKEQKLPLEKYTFLTTQIVPYIKEYQTIITQFHSFKAFIAIFNAIG